MTVAYDIYSETNPAFCTYALAAFTSAYASINKNGPEVPVAYLSLPIALSGDLEETFAGTNRNTGLLEWLERSPQVQIGLATRLNASLEIVTDAIRLGCYVRILKLSNEARLVLGEQKLKKTPIKSLGEDTGGVMKRAERLGYWFALAGSTRTVFDMMGLTL